MNLKLFAVFDGSVSTQLISNPKWKVISDHGRTVYFHPEEATHEFVGELFLKNYSINFIPFTGPVTLEEREIAFFLVRDEPDGVRLDGVRTIIPAKGTTYATYKDTCE